MKNNDWKNLLNAKAVCVDCGQEWNPCLEDHDNCPEETIDGVRLKLKVEKNKIKDLKTNLEQKTRALMSLHRAAITKPAWCGSGLILDITTKHLDEEQQKESLKNA